MTRPHDDHEHDELQERAGHDERLTLPVEQGVLLWCMRMWVLELRRGVGAEPRIEDMLDQLGVAAAAPCLKDLMSSLSRGCTRMDRGAVRVPETDRRGRAGAARPYWHWRRQCGDSRRC